jgi:hypothetical protein
LPPEIPPGATITSVYPVIIALGDNSNSIATVGDDAAPIYQSLGTPFSGTYYGHFHSSLTGLELNASLQRSLFPHGPPDPPFHDTLDISFVGAAVYYKGTPLTKASLVYEAMNDVRIGGPAKIWYGLWSNGAFIGTPYLAFSGTVDKPTVNTGTTSSSITLALENRLINLQRANQRRYTAADQHLAYPDDLAFNWVELLNDMSLKEGTA